MRIRGTLLALLAVSALLSARQGPGANCQDLATCETEAEIKEVKGTPSVIIVGPHTPGRCDCKPKDGGEVLTCQLVASCVIDLTYTAQNPVGSWKDKNGVCHEYEGGVGPRFKIKVNTCGGNADGSFELYGVGDDDCSGTSFAKYHIEWKCTADVCSDGNCD